jgi:hypothetical protein
MTHAQAFGSGGHRPRRPSGLELKKVALTAGAVLATINVWTGAPLLALWLGSLLFPSMALSFGALLFVVAVIAVMASLLAMAIVRLSAAYDELTGRPLEARHASPWLRWERGEREPASRTRVPVSTIELAVITVLVVSVVLIETYFFLFDHPALPHPTN